MHADSHVILSLYRFVPGRPATDLFEHIDAQRRRQIGVGGSRFVDLGDQFRQPLAAASGDRAKLSEELFFQRKTGAMAANRDRPLPHPAHSSILSNVFKRLSADSRRWPSSRFFAVSACCFSSARSALERPKTVRFWSANASFAARA
jgi:hypothetical protein